MSLPTWLQWYKKPDYKDIKEYSTSITHGQRALSPEGRKSTCIPPRLRLDRILANKTCSPMSLYDFYMYLTHIEYSVENLEFYVWFMNYEATWAKLNSGAIKAIKGDDAIPCAADWEGSESSATARGSPDASEPDDEPATAARREHEQVQATLARITQLIDSPSKCGSRSGTPTLCTVPRSLCDAKNSPLATATQPPTFAPHSSIYEISIAANALASATNKTTTTAATSITGGDGIAASLRIDLQNVIRLFLLPGSEKELNIPPAMRDAALSKVRHHAASQMPTDPAVLAPIAAHVYGLLRNCSHRNFVRLGVGNSTMENLCVATGLGIVLNLAGFLLVLLRGLGTPHIGAHSRWDVFAAWPFWWLGSSLVLAGLRGSCFFLLLFTRRQPLPWERFDDDQEDPVHGGGGDVGDDVAATKWKKRKTLLGWLWRRVSRIMIFDRKMKVQDENLRRLQHKIVVQSLVGGTVFASFGVILFIFLPMWRD